MFCSILGGLVFKVIFLKPNKIKFVKFYLFEMILNISILEFGFIAIAFSISYALSGVFFCAQANIVCKNERVLR